MILIESLFNITLCSIIIKFFDNTADEILEGKWSDTFSNFDSNGIMIKKKEK